MIQCIDCHQPFKVDGIVKNKKRCDDCQKIYRKQQINNNAKLYYHNNIK